MPYDVTFVEFSGGLGGIQSNSLSGFPTSFNFLLMSLWGCLPIRTVPPGAPCNISTGSLFQNISATSQHIQVTLKNLSGPFYNAQFSGPAPNQRYNLLVSVDCLSQTTQVYCNDVIAPLTSGGWTSSASFGSGTTTFFNVDQGVGSFNPATADIWMAATTGFVDLSITANRRKFINHNLTPVDLGSDGSEPTGASPPVYLTIPSGGVASDFQTNFGTGGSLPLLTFGASISLQTPGTCTLPPPPGSRPLVSIIGHSAPP